MEENTKPYRALEIHLAAREYSVVLGEEVIVPFAVTNHTREEDYFDISIQGIPTAWLVLDLPVIRLAAGERREASVTIHAPGNSPVSVGQYPVTLQVISQSDSALRGEEQFTLRVSAYEETVAASPDDTTMAGATVPGMTEPGMAAPFDSGGRIGLILDTVQFNAAPGDTLSIPVVIANRGMHEDTFFLSVNGLPPSWVSVAVPSLRLMPGERGEVLLYIQPPQGPAGRAGRHTFSIQAGAHSDPGQVASVEAVLTLAALSQYIADLTPRRIDAGQTARLRIHNLGNFQETFTLRFQSAEGQLEFVPSVAGPVQLSPGETATIDFAVSPRSPNLFGSPTKYSYSVLVQSGGGETQGYNGEVVSRSLIPIWVIPAVAVFCLTALCGMGFLWNWNQNRLSWATRTADAQLGMIEEQTATALAFEMQAATATLLALETQSALETSIVIEGEAAAAATATALAFAAEGTALAEATITADALATEAAALLAATEAAAAATAAQDAIAATAFAIAQAQTATAAALAVPTPTQTEVPAATPTTAPVATPTVVPLPVTGEQIIAFVSNRDGDQRLYLFQSSDGTISPLTEGNGADTQPAWSPDGSQLAFTSNRDGNNEIYLYDFEDGSQVNLTQNPSDDRFPAWSPDGEQIAFTTDRDGNNEIYVVNVDGTDPTNLTNNPANDYKPAWFIDQALFGATSRILFTSDRDGNNEIYSMNADGSEPVNLTENSASDTLPAVPFEGGMAAFVSDRDGTLDIFTMRPDGENQQNITNSQSSDTRPTWAPDGAWIAFNSNRDGHREIYIIGAGGEELTNVTHSTAEDYDPAWR